MRVTPVSHVVRRDERVCQKSSIGGVGADGRRERTGLEERTGWMLDALVRVVLSKESGWRGMGKPAGRSGSLAMQKGESRVERRGQQADSTWEMGDVGVEGERGEGVGLFEMAGRREMRMFAMR
jgi:hypothetical protein